MSMCRVFSCVVGKHSAFSWQNSVSLCPDSFCTPRPNLPVTPGKKLDLDLVLSLPSVATPKQVTCLGGSVVKKLFASARDAGGMRSVPGQEDPLEWEMTTPSYIFALKIPQT